MVYPCKQCGEKCDKESCSRLKEYKAFRKKAIDQTRAWARESLAVNYKEAAKPT